MILQWLNPLIVLLVDRVGAGEGKGSGGHALQGEISTSIPVILFELTNLYCFQVATLGYSFGCTGWCHGSEAGEAGVVTMATSYLTTNPRERKRIIWCPVKFYVEKTFEYKWNDVCIIYNYRWQLSQGVDSSLITKINTTILRLRSQCLFFSKCPACICCKEGRLLNENLFRRCCLITEYLHRYIHTCIHKMYNLSITNAPGTSIFNFFI